MAKRGFRRRLLRVVAPVVVGGSLFQLGSCDPVVRDTLLAGLETTTEALTDTLIQVFFTGLADDESTSGTGGGTAGLTTT